MGNANSITFAYLISQEYLHKALVSVRSIQQFYPSMIDFHIAYYDSQLPSKEVQELFGKNVYWHLKGKLQNFWGIYADRPLFVLELFEDGYKQVNHIGADVVAYSESIDLQLTYSQDAAFICHSHLPNNNPVHLHKTGLLNSDLTYWRFSEDSINFLKWQAEQLKQVNSDKEGYFFDQVYLDFALTQCSEVQILTPNSYGKAYYNLHEGFSRTNLVAFHFSGFMEEFPSLLSKFNFDKKHLTVEVVQLALEYGERLYAAKEEIKQANSTEARVLRHYPMFR